MATKSSPADKARASARAALECVNKKMDPSCTECIDLPAVRAVILFPNLGTPLILPSGEKKLNFFIAAEAKSRNLFGVAPGGTFPKPAVTGYMYVDKHLRVYPIASKKLREDTKDGRLYSDGKTCATAFQHVKVWCLGPLDGGTINDISGKRFAHIRPKTIEGYNNTQPAHADKLDPLVANESLEWLYQIQIDLDGLPNAPSAGNIVTLAWMVPVPNTYKKQKDLAGISDWEYQDKLVYDFLEMQKKNPRKNHIPDLYEFDVTTASSNRLPKQKTEVPRRLKAWHPVSIGKSDALKIGHLTDVHVNSRQFALANSNACVLEGISAKVGSKLDNCFMALKELFENMKDAGADAIFLTGDLLDFNRNLDPRGVSSPNPKDQWKSYDLASKVSDKSLYPRGMDDMLIFSLIRYSYEKLALPVFIITGNHEAYDVPYGISPRANPFVLKGALDQISNDFTVAMPARLRAVDTVKRAHSVASVIVPVYGINSKLAQNSAEYFLNKAKRKRGLTDDPSSVGDLKMNEGIPADHNLTIYEACLIYGPTFPQVVKPFNFTPDNFDWFFSLFTPLADYAIEYGRQVLVGLDWGDSEIMVNLDIEVREGVQAYLNDETVMGALSGLPRANMSLSDRQKILIEGAVKTGKKVMLFTHFTLINYDGSIPLDAKVKRFAARDDVFNGYTKGTFSRGRDWLYPKMNNGIHYTLAGHSHRSGVYRLENTDPNAMFTVGYQPAELGKVCPRASGLHSKLFINEHASRIVVSSCGGPIGGQNNSGELNGWNLMPPSGTLLDIDASGPAELQRVITKKYRPGKPRFCVALDYVQVHAEKDVVAWVPMGEPGHGHYWLFVANVPHAQHFIEKVTFYVWDQSERKFVPYRFHMAPIPDKPNVYDGYIQDPKRFFKKVLPMVEGIPAEPFFVQIEFNQALAENNLYSQYNFSDPWIFRMDAEARGNYDPLIRPAQQRRAEIPDWVWLGQVDPAKYPATDIKKKRVKNGTA